MVYFWGVLKENRVLFLRVKTGNIKAFILVRPLATDSAFCCCTKYLLEWMDALAVSNSVVLGVDQCVLSIKKSHLPPL